MEIVVRSRNGAVTPRVRALADGKVARLARLAHDVSRVEVDFSELRNPRVAEPQQCEIIVHLKGHLVTAHASASEAVAALDLALDKVEHQVARIKEKRVARSHPRGSGGGRAADGSGG
jgi:ribosomal subunit interface protein